MRPGLAGLVGERGFKLADLPPASQQLCLAPVFAGCEVGVQRDLLEARQLLEPVSMLPAVLVGDE